MMIRRLRPQVTVAYGTVNIERALALAAERQMRGHTTFVVGIVRYPRGKCWWLGIARPHAALEWVSAYHLRQQADAQIPIVERAAAEGALKDGKRFAELLQDLSADGEPDLQPTLAVAPYIAVRPDPAQAPTNASPFLPGYPAQLQS
jgi:hypothetical protein